MCWVCLPTCGACRPAREKMLACPRCGAFNHVKMQVTKTPVETLCESCGADITMTTLFIPRYCSRYETMCGGPCGRSETPYKGSTRGRCEWHTPLSQSYFEDHEVPEEVLAVHAAAGLAG